MIKYFENFLTEQECESLIKLIDSNHTRSSVVGAGTELTGVSEVRTSSTSNLDASIDLVNTVHKRISEKLGIQLDKGESLQGQLYTPGQFFKPHTDYFEKESYDKHCLSSGNRTYTFMIYLNDVEEGGETNFPSLNLSIKPKKGMAVGWPDMVEGKPATEYLHEGSPVTTGKKYIITSWWRENTWNNVEDTRLYNELISSSFNQTTIPKLTPKGYKVVKVPTKAWELIQKAYNEVKDKEMEEQFPGKDYFIPGNKISSTILPLDYTPELRNQIHQELLPIHEEFCGEELEPSYLYGIRSYKRGAKLTEHTDRMETHHIASTVVVDKDLRCGCQHKDLADDWSLDIQTHDGEWNKVTAEIGEMIIYESIACQHGRLQPFGGTNYKGLFAHYQFKNRQYKE